MKLFQEKTFPCGPTVPALSLDEVTLLLKELTSSWKKEDEKITRTFVFKDFIEAMQFVNTVSAIAEEASHHPDIYIFYNKVRLTLWTHAIGGLSRNDFIVASRIDLL